MKILVFNQQEDLSIAQSTVETVIRQVLSKENKNTDEVTVYFVSTDKICQLHRDFFDDPTTTDCISFPMDTDYSSGYHILGEIFVCPKTAIDYLVSRRENIKENCYKETTLYLVHGLLHLIGYKDIEDEDQQAMRRAEHRHMEQLIRQKLLLSG